MQYKSYKGDRGMREELLAIIEKNSRIDLKELAVILGVEYLDLVEHLRKTERGKELYAMRKETIERVFADAKEKHAMRYTHHRGLARVSAWVRLKYAAMNLKKIAIWKWNASNFASYIMIFAPFNDKTPVLVF
jgi:hypothetical protein